MGGGKYLIDGKVWSAEAFRLYKATTLSGSSETLLGTQAPATGVAPVAIVSASGDDTGPTVRTIVLGIDGSIDPGDIIQMTIGTLDPVQYTVTGEENNMNDIATTFESGYVGNGVFALTNDTSVITLTALVAGVAANDVTVVWEILTETNPVSVSNTDGTAGGTDAQSVRVDYIDIDGYETRETLGLNGTTPVVTSKDALWVNRITIVATGGAMSSAAITASINEDNQLTIAAGAAQSATTLYMVPLGKQLRINCITATSDNAAGTNVSSSRFKLLSNYDPQTKTLLDGSLPFVIANWWGSSVPEEIELPYYAGPFHERAIIAVAATGGNNHIVLVNVDAYLEPMGLYDTI